MTRFDEPRRTTRLTLTTARLRVVPLNRRALDAWVAGDRDALSALTGASFPEPPVAPPLFDEDLVSIRDAMPAEDADAPDAIWLMVEGNSGRAIGVAGANTEGDQGKVTIGYSVYPEHESRGFATEAMRALVDWLLEQPAVNIVEATIPPWNVPSIRVAEKLGMSVAGTARDAEVGDVTVYRLQRQDATEGVALHRPD